MSNSLQPLFEVQFIDGDDPEVDEEQEEEEDEYDEYDEELEKTDRLTVNLPVADYSINLFLLKGEYGCTYIGGDLIHKTAGQIGTLKGYLVDRETLRQNAVWFEATDSHSHGLMQIGWNLFNKFGVMAEPLRSTVESELPEGAPNPNRLGFLYLEDVKINAAHDVPDLALHAINTFLKYAGDYAWPDWTLCICYDEPHMDDRVGFKYVPESARLQQRFKYITLEHFRSLQQQQKQLQN
jgi:hypothetical protein